jgi:lipocalin-like protein
MASTDASALIGTWKQLSGTMVEEGSTSSRSNLSAAPNGFVNFSADGRLILLSTDSARKKPAGEVPTAAEAEALYRSMIAYAGTYELEGNKVTYHLEATWNESWTGTKQVRFWKIEGDQLTITTPEIVNPLTGKRSVFRLTFRKIGGHAA